MAVEVTSVQVIKGVQGCDAVIHRLQVFCSIGEGFSAQEADLFFWGHEMEVEEGTWARA